MDKRKQSQVARMRTEAIETILSTLGGAELKEPSEEYPLGGLVHITGIGQVKITELEAELARRTADDDDDFATEAKREEAE